MDFSRQLKLGFHDSVLKSEVPLYIRGPYINTNGWARARKFSWLAIEVKGLSLLLGTVKVLNKMHLST